MDSVLLITVSELILNVSPISRQYVATFLTLVKGTLLPTGTDSCMMSSHNMNMVVSIRVALTGRI